jgi:hypothetical protein
MIPGCEIPFPSNQSLFSHPQQLRPFQSAIVAQAPVLSRNGPLTLLMFVPFVCRRLGRTIQVKVILNSEHFAPVNSLFLIRGSLAFYLSFGQIGAAHLGNSLRNFSERKADHRHVLFTNYSMR